jgi:hypothetical protein
VFVFCLVTFALGVAVYLVRATRIVNFILLLFSLSLCLTGLEVYCRYFYMESDGLGLLSQNFAARYYQYDEYGLRDSHLPLSDTKPNIVVVGDSHVFGAGLKSSNDRFCEKVASHFPGFHFVSLAFSGWDTKTEMKQALNYLGENSKAKVPLVILVYYFNDIDEDVTPADRARVIPAVKHAEPTWLDHLFQSLSKRSRFVELFYYRIGYPRLIRDRVSQTLMFYDDPEIRSRHLGTLEQFRSIMATKYGARTVMVLLPYLHNDEILRYTGFYERFRRTLDEHQFDYVDLQPTFAAFPVTKLKVNRFDPHTNAFANDLIANAVAPKVEALKR